MKETNPNVINGEYKLSEWVRLYLAGSFNNMWEMEDAGFFDWWCDREELFERFKKIAPKVVEIAKSPLIDTEKTYVFFKNNCPCEGPLYDSFSICDIESCEVLFWLGNIESGCYGDKRSGWEVHDYREGVIQPIDIEKPLEYVEWDIVKKYFEI